MDPTQEPTGMHAVEAKLATSRRANTSAKMHEALRFARTWPGRITMSSRAALSSLGAFGAVLLALYPVAVGLAVSVVLFLYRDAV